MSLPAPTAKPLLGPATTGPEAIGAIRGLIRRGEYLAASIGGHRRGVAAEADTVHSAWHGGT